MKPCVDFQILSESELTDVYGGKINWGSVVGNCIGGAIIAGAFSGPISAGVACIVGGGKAIIYG
ncbi:class IIb bacteriocin, lactobin A/cerein 7B family [Streptococcus cuniculipharyngis]|uniref:Class IIb bacteriocin, lactobin A/cerein 7B family n=1 Tax=Streptococcus cuniculipharyngis TaxID=1562651 RepID=A0A5C5SEN4_9STRE|nr:class IIb bacteriocin, lactobin A/cerein 7B family [Streptococcus cuniculipharyngis]TWS98802.1 class IIb bacteriocin, lactobin A/cerein 7B family [Streptococcus cuniculipharyngis]